MTTLTLTDNLTVEIHYNPETETGTATLRQLDAELPYLPDYSPSEWRGYGSTWNIARGTGGGLNLYGAIYPKSAADQALQAAGMTPAEVAERVLMALGLPVPPSAPPAPLARQLGGESDGENHPAGGGSWSQDEEGVEEPPEGDGPGRPALVPGEETERVSVSLPASLIADLRGRAEAEGESLSELIRGALSAPTRPYSQDRPASGRELQPRLLETIRLLLSGKYTRVQIAELLGVSERQAARYLRDLQRLGAEIVLEGGQPSRYRLTGLRWLVPEAERAAVAAELLASLQIHCIDDNGQRVSRCPVGGERVLSPDNLLRAELARIESLPPEDAGSGILLILDPTGRELARAEYGDRSWRP